MLMLHLSKLLSRSKDISFISFIKKLFNLITSVLVQFTEFNIWPSAPRDRMSFLGAEAKISILQSPDSHFHVLSYPDTDKMQSVTAT